MPSPTSPHNRRSTRSGLLKEGSHLPRRADRTRCSAYRARRSAAASVLASPGSSWRRPLMKNLGVRVLLTQRKMPEHEPNLASELLQHTLQRGVGAAAKRALEVAVLHQRHRSLRRSQHVIARADGGYEQRHKGRFNIACSCARQRATVSSTLMGDSPYHLELRQLSHVVTRHGSESTRKGSGAMS